MSLFHKLLILTTVVWMFWSVTASGAAIHDAAKSGNLDTVVAFVASDPNAIKSVDQYGRTPLHYACRGVHPEVVRFLVEHGAEVNAIDINGITPLLSVATRGHAEATKILLGKGADFNRQAKLDKGSALHYAAMSGHVEVLRLLLERGASLAITDGEERTPLQVAVAASKPEAVAILTEKTRAVDPALLDAKDFDGNTALHLACLNCDSATAAILVQAGASINAANSVGQRAIHVASACQSGAIGNLLDRPGVDRSPQRFPAMTGPYLGQSLPGTEPQLFAKGIISKSNGMHCCIDFSPSLDEVAWASRDTIYLMRVVDGYWHAPSAIPFIKPNYGVDAPFFSFDGNRLYFLAGALSPEGMSGRNGLWYMDRIATGWAEPREYDSVVNSTPNHWQMSMSRRGDVFHSDGHGHISCSKFENGRYTSPARLAGISDDIPDSVHMAGDIGPLVSPDGDFVIFTRFLPPPTPGGGMFISFRIPDGTWTKPQDLGEKLGGASTAARLSPDGKYLFFLSSRPGSARERSVYWVDAAVIDEMRSQNNEL